MPRTNVLPHSNEMCLSHSLSRLMQGNEAQLKNHQANQLADGAKLHLYRRAVPQVSLFQTKEMLSKCIGMKLLVRIVLSLFCGTSTAALWLDRLPRAADRFGDQTPDQPEVLEPPGSPDPRHGNHFGHSHASRRYCSSAHASVVATDVYINVSYHRPLHLINKKGR